MTVAPTYAIQKRYRLRKARGETAYVDTTPARHHIATLRGHGWSMRAIAGASSVPHSTIADIAAGRRLTARPRTITAIRRLDPQSLPSQPSPHTSSVFVSRVGTVRRIQALMFMGYSHTALKSHGVNSANLLNQQGQWVRRVTHDHVAAVYARLWKTPGPSARAAREARARGLAGPMQWDDIDHDPMPDLDPPDTGEDLYDAVTVERILAGENLPASNAERREVVARWVSTGRSLNDLERLTGWQPHRYKVAS